MAGKGCKRGSIFEYREEPLVFLNEPSAIRDTAQGVEFRTAEMVKGLLEERLQQIERDTGRRPRGKGLRELKEAIVHELLPLDPLLQLPVTFAPETGE